ncbi:MAG: MotA/TolQ/ExbB proton channel family protein [Opitutales bacterium]
MILAQRFFLMPALAVLSFALLTPAFAAEQSAFDSAASIAGSDLEAALAELKQSRDEIANEKIPLVRRQRELEAEVSRLRREFTEQRRIRDSGQAELQSLRATVKGRQDQHQYQQGLIAEYLRELESKLPVSEITRFGALSGTERNEAIEDDSLSLATDLEAVRLSLVRIREQIGGRGYDGEAAGPGGTIESGRFLEIGPVILFSAEGFAGFAGERVGSLKAHVTAPGRNHAAQSREVVETGRGLFPFDPTLGQATRRAEAQTTLVERVQAGGVVMFPILALALGALIIALLKWIQIAGIKATAPGTLQEILNLLDNGRTQEAAQRARAVRGPVGKLLQAAVENAHQRREILEEILYEKILHSQPQLERYLPFLALTAAAAPLLGLLGTVTGMINTFQLITLFGAGDARTLSGGISEALITTQFGLGVAIIALLVHALLSRKAKGVIANMEQTEAAFLNGLPRVEEPSHD